MASLVGLADMAPAVPDKKLVLRRYYAAKAMQSLLSMYSKTDIFLHSDIARDAFEIADAMIAEEQKQ